MHTHSHYPTAHLPPLSISITNVTSTTATLTLSHPHITSTHSPDSYRIAYSRITGEGQVGGCPGNEENENGTILLYPPQDNFILNGLEEV